MCPRAFDVLHAEITGGLIAAWTYGWTRVTPAIDEIMTGYREDVIGAYWPPERRYVDELYATIPFPFREIKAPLFTAGSAFIGEAVLRSGYFIQTLRDRWPSLRHLLLFGVVMAVEQRHTFVASAQMKPGLESKVRIVLNGFSESQAALSRRVIGTRTRFSASYADPVNQCEAPWVS